MFGPGRWGILLAGKVGDKIADEIVGRFFDWLDESDERHKREKHIGPDAPLFVSQRLHRLTKVAFRAGTALAPSATSIISAAAAAIVAASIARTPKS